MKRYYLPVLISIVLISTLFISCVPMSGSSSSSSSALASLTKRLDTLEANEKTTNETNSKQTSDISELQQNKLSKSEYTGAADTYGKTELYTRSEIDSRIKSLQNQIDDLKNQTNGSSDNSNNSDNLVDTDDDLELYLESVNPSTDPFLLSDSSDIRFEFSVKNNHEVNSRQFEVIITMYPSEDILVYTTTDGDIFSDTSMEIAIEPQDDVTPLDEGDPLYIKCTNGWVGKNDSQDFTALVSLETGSSAEWDYNIDIRQTN